MNFLWLGKGHKLGILHCKEELDVEECMSFFNKVEGEVIFGRGAVGGCGMLWSTWRIWRRAGTSGWEMS